ncbi:glycosyltransferase involved in cell wall biosynthesis [Salinibacter ruber]|uniref:glycosyltransferase family 4 protein n=1 Tax=Salinibacter ruber TaxID=146919 RepID=UPI0021679D39|nr:glycosyltransferase family 4 protein [Salinibacter ruber]MCS3937290.1 glycosyltransferase involved in cell wall biosynthesis [Salinibacter ruber]
MSNEVVPKDWVVAQIGARENYAVPRAVHRAGRLRRLYTDAWCSWGRSILKRGPQLAQGFANRYHPELPDDRVTAFTGAAVPNILWRHWHHGTGSRTDLEDHHIEVGRQFAENVCNHLAGSSLDPDRHAFLGFSTGSYEVLDALRGSGVLTVVDQVAPGPIEQTIVAEEAERWPEWALEVPEERPRLQGRAAAEWEAATLVLVNSDWSRSALIEEGVPEEKIIVVPCAYEPPRDLGECPPTPPDEDQPLRVLWLGSVILRKGIQYFVEAARCLQDRNLEIKVAGPIGIAEEYVRRAPENMSFIGRVQRDQTTTLYDWADVFVFPTLSDGFGVTQLEAMAHGCPVITTPNCARVVTDGTDGILAAPRSAEEIADALASLDDARSRVAEMGRAALKTAQKYSIDAYARRLFDAVEAKLRS